MIFFSNFSFTTSPTTTTSHSIRPSCFFDIFFRFCHSPASIPSLTPRRQPHQRNLRPTTTTTTKRRCSSRKRWKLSAGIRRRAGRSRLGSIFRAIRLGSGPARGTFVEHADERTTVLRTIAEIVVVLRNDATRRPTISSFRDDFTVIYKTREKER